MYWQPQIAFRDMRRSIALEALVRERIERLNLYHAQIRSCRVVIARVQKRQRQGQLFNVRIDMTAPGGELTVDRDAAEDVHVAIRDAFDAMRRRLEDLGRKVRGDVKTHEVPLQGTVARLFPHDGYGFIDVGGDEYYFHRENVVQSGYDQLHVGDSVSFLPDETGDSPQAHRVSVTEAVRPAQMA